MMAEKITISNDILKVTINSFGAEIESVLKDGKEKLWDGNPEIWAGHAPVLFPICGGLRDDKFIFEGKEYILGKHGYARRSEFEIEKAEENSAVFKLSSNEETLNKYPFEYDFRITYSLEGSKINVEYAVTNKGEKDMYFSVGAHEAYACPEGIEEYSVIFDEEENLDAADLDGSLLKYTVTSWGKGIKELPLKQEHFLPDALVFLNLKSRGVILKNRKTKEEIRVSFEGFDYFLIWTKPGAKYVCLEPWCGIPDFVDSSYDITKKRGIMTVASKETLKKYHSVIF